MVRVLLIAKTSPFLNPMPLEQFLGRIGKWSRSPEIPLLDLKKPQDSWEELLMRIVKEGHTSILEHVSFTFLIWDVSRVLTHQLVRHRIASYTQKSHRVLKVEDFILPESAKKVLDKVAFEESGFPNPPLWWYNKMLQEGISREDARYFAPQGSKTAIIMTMNLRELHEVFLPLRLAPNAQKEIRDLAGMILDTCKGECPSLFQELKRNGE